MADYDAKDLKNWANSQLSADDGSDMEEEDTGETDQMSEKEQAKALFDAAERLRKVVTDIEGQVDEAQSNELTAIAHLLEKLSGMETPDAGEEDDTDDSEDADAGADDGSED